jgi:hypothetical protein
MSAQKKPRSGIRAIDQGTRYDVIGSIKQLEREIERGEHGEISDVVVLILEKRNNRSPAVQFRHFGTASFPTLHYMIATAKNRIEPA